MDELAKAPDLPDQLITLKIDYSTHHAYIDQSNLLRAMQHMRDYVRQLHRQAIQGMRCELEGHVEHMKKDVAISLQESLLEFEHTFKSRLEDVEAASIRAMAMSEEVRALLDSGATPATPFAGSVARAEVQEPDSSTVATPLVRLPEEEPKRRSSLQLRRGSTTALHSVHGGGRANTIASGNPMSKTVGGRVGAGVDEDALTSLLQAHASGDLLGGGLKKSDLKEFALQEEVESIEWRVATLEGQLAEAREVQAKAEELAAKLRQELSQQGQASKDLQTELIATVRSSDRDRERLETLDTAMKGVGQQLGQSEKARQKLAESLEIQVVRLDELQSESCDIKTHMAASLSEAEALALRLEPLELVSQSQQDSLRLCDSRLQDAERSAGELQATLQEQRGKTEALQLVQAPLRARLEDVTGRAEMTETQLLELQGRFERELARLAEESLVPTGVAELQDAVVELRNIRTEPAVLFGARCLSCNREFDDVRRDNGAVDTRAERQRVQLLTEVQRMMHTEPGQIQALVGRHCPTTTRRRPATSDARPREAFQPTACKDGPMDFKLPLSQLLGRTRREDCAAEQRPLSDRSPLPAVHGV